MERMLRCADKIIFLGKVDAFQEHTMVGLMENTHVLMIPDIPAFLTTFQC